jgi:hypothetical protein
MPSVGRRRKAELGGFACGAPCYGYKAERGVARASELRLGGASYRVIARRSTPRVSSRAGQRWHPNVVRRMLFSHTDVAITPD